MKTIIKNLITSLGVLVALVAPAALSTSVYAADVNNSLCKGADLKLSGNADCEASTGDASNKLDSLITDIVNIFSVVVGVVAVIMIIYGGFRYITSGGDSGNVTNAKNTILYALVGLVIVALAQFIVKFVLSKATGLGN
jgi:cytochrome bd-type quinol oxidase subunit 2